MKTKKIISFIAFIAIIVGGYTKPSMENCKSYSIALSNLEALAENESGGISVRECCTRDQIEEDKSSVYDVNTCSASTTSSMIYRCSGKITGKKKYYATIYTCYN
ncbi:NVEALA domain-containing protein [Phocaeicola sp.]